MSRMERETHVGHPMSTASSVIRSWWFLTEPGSREVLSSFPWKSTALGREINLGNGW